MLIELLLYKMFVLVKLSVVSWFSSVMPAEFKVARNESKREK